MFKVLRVLIALIKRKKKQIWCTKMGRNGQKKGEMGLKMPVVCNIHFRD